MKVEEVKGDNKRGQDAAKLDKEEQQAKKQKVDKSEAKEDKKEKSEKELKEAIKEAYLCEMPEDFFAFWRFCKERKTEKPEEAILAATGLKLVGPFDIMAGKEADKPEDYLVNWRYYYDVPEFTTLLADPETNFHLGYFRDHPSNPPDFVASNDSSSCKLTMMGENLFGALYNHVGHLIQSAGDPFKQTALQKLKESLHVFATMKVTHLDLSLDAKTRQMKSRDKLKLAATFHGAGMVVPYNKETQVGYREIPETTASLKKIFKNVVEAEKQEDKDKAGDVLQELITNVQFANDEGDPGMGLELGLDAFCYGGEQLHTAIKHLLSVGYELLDRSAYAQIIAEHLQRRSKDKPFMIGGEEQS